MKHGRYVRALISGEINKLKARPEIQLDIRRMDVK